MNVWFNQHRIIGMIDNESWFSAVHFFNVLFFCIVDFYFFGISPFGIIGGETSRLFEGSIGKFFSVCFYNNMRSRYSFCMKPPVISYGKLKGQFFVLIVIFSYIDMKSVTGEIVKRFAGDFLFFWRWSVFAEYSRRQLVPL